MHKEIFWVSLLVVILFAIGALSVYSILIAVMEIYNHLKFDEPIAWYPFIIIASILLLGKILLFISNVYKLRIEKKREERIKNIKTKYSIFEQRLMKMKQQKKEEEDGSN